MDKRFYEDLDFSDCLWLQLLRSPSHAHSGDTTARLVLRQYNPDFCPRLIAQAHKQKVLDNFQAELIHR